MTARRWQQKANIEEIIVKFNHLKRIERHRLSKDDDEENNYIDYNNNNNILIMYSLKIRHIYVYLIIRLIYRSILIEIRSQCCALFILYITPMYYSLFNSIPDDYFEKLLSNT